METKYKDSNIPWIGRIPQHWKICRVKDFSSIYSGDPLPADKITDEKLYPVYGGGDVLGYSKSYNVVENNLILGRVGGDGTVRNIKCNFWATDNALIINTNLNKTYLCNCLNCADLTSLNTSTSQPLLTATKIKNVEIPFPPLAEQERIAGYLDKKCGDIDELIDVEQQMIADLEAYRQAIITEATTRGLNPDAPTKETGIPWIPIIPKHWSIHYLRGISNGFRKGNGITKEDLLTNGDINCIRYGDLYTKYDHNIYNVKCKTNLNRISNPVFASYGDIYFTCSGEDINAIGKSAAFLSNDRCLVGGDLIIMKHSQNPKFLGYSLDSEISQKQKSYGKSKLKVVHTSVKDLKNVAVAIPPLSEQEEIAEYLDRKCGEIDELVTVKREKIATLKEYRKSLIYEAVTGKISCE